MVSVRNIIHKVLDTSKALLRAGKRNGVGVGAFAWTSLVLGYRLGLKTTVSMQISKRWVLTGYRRPLSCGRVSGARTFLSTVSSLYRDSGFGGSVWESVSVVTSLELSWSFRSTTSSLLAELVSSRLTGLPRYPHSSA